MRPKIASFVTLAGICIVLAGCSSGDFGYVEGTITVDGKPVENATIGFYPDGGRGSIGQTDSDGHYELLYTNAQKGASIGEHRVTIATLIARVTPKYQDERSIALGEAPPEAVEGRKEMLDKSYRDRKTTPLTATVVGGKNPPINFDLESGNKKK